jgi:HTH-type transcriptional regulator/antitoxin HigA
MEIMNTHIQIEHLLPAWEIFRRTTDIAPIRDEAHYRRMVAILEALLDESSGNENHPAMGLIDIVGDLIADFEAEHHPLPNATGLQALKFLMEQHGLKQDDLRAWLRRGSQSSVGHTEGQSTS